MGFFCFCFDVGGGVFLFVCFSGVERSGSMGRFKEKWVSALARGHGRTESLCSCFYMRFCTFVVVVKWFQRVVNFM